MIFTDQLNGQEHVFNQKYPTKQATIKVDYGNGNKGTMSITLRVDYLVHRF